MMEELRLSWEPESLCSAASVSEQVMKYMDKDVTFAQFGNDTCLMLKPVPNLQETIEGCLREARRIAEFKVYRMEEGDYLVFFASPLIVYVGKDEFMKRQTEIRRRLHDLSFPSETVISAFEETDDINLLVGLYARGKLQRDAWGSLNYTLVKPDTR
jgi:hypothetical protein